MKKERQRAKVGRGSSFGWGEKKKSTTNKAGTKARSEAILEKHKKKPAIPLKYRAGTGKDGRKRGRKVNDRPGAKERGVQLT